MLNIKLTEECLDNPIWTNEPFCQCEKKIIRKSNPFDSRIKSFIVNCAIVLY